MKITNMAKQVGEVRTRFPGGKREIICMECRTRYARTTLGITENPDP